MENAEKDIKEKQGETETMGKGTNLLTPVEKRKGLPFYLSLLTIGYCQMRQIAGATVQ